MEVTVEKLKKMIQSLLEARSIVRLYKGYSHDQKWIVTNGNNEKTLLRISPKGSFKKRQEEFSVLQRLRAFEVKTVKPIEIGLIDEYCYTMYSYLDGADAQSTFYQFDDQTQYLMGLAAGKELKNIHQLQAPETITPWSERAIEKHKRYAKAYWDGSARVKDDQKVLRYIDQNLHILQSRPNQLQHDDYHPGNIIVENGQFGGVIDFNVDWGDPFHDFYKVALFTSEQSVPFSIGQIHGYFDGAKQVPDKFWQLYSLYAAMAVFSSIVWADRNVPHESFEMKKRVQRLIEEHKGFQEIKPGWYQEKYL